MARKMKGGDGDFIGNMFAAGVGAYAAKNSTSMGGLLWTLAKYALVIIAILIVVFIIMILLGGVQERFSVPIAPSKTGDEKKVTPSGNVILY